jgi:hypothetical protein
LSALLDSLSARCKHRPPPDATWYASSSKSWAYQQISSADALNCIRLAGLILSNHYAAIDNPVNAAIIDDYIPAANTSAAPVAEVLFLIKILPLLFRPLPCPPLPLPYHSLISLNNILFYFFYNACYFQLK